MGKAQKTVAGLISPHPVLTGLTFTLKQNKGRASVFIEFGASAFYPALSSNICYTTFNIKKNNN